jgi:hypothetical protein
MKLRIRGNSIRLRLLQTEVTTLVETGTVSEAISFGASALTYSVISSTLTNEVNAQFTDGEITIVVPETIIKTWADSVQVSIEKDQRIDADGALLQILIEKDFVCIGREDDPDNANAFPNPAAVEC